MKTMLQNIYLRKTEISYVLSPINNNATDSSKPVIYMAFALTTANVPTTLYFNNANSTSGRGFLKLCVCVCKSVSVNYSDSKINNKPTH